VIDIRSLARALARRGASAWAVVEREQRIATVDPDVARTEQRTRWYLTVHIDTPTGRGTAHVRLDVLADSPDAVAERATSLAHAGLGPAWSSPPPAAPARVDLDDGSLHDPVAAAKAALPRRAGIFASVTAMRELVSVTTHAGFHTGWAATLVRVDALVAHADRSLAISRASRTLDGLDLDAAIAGAQHDLEKLAVARAAPAGPCTLVLDADAMLHGGLGVWEAFVPQADAGTERQGLTRYREHAPIVEGADTVAEPLTIESDGALAYGLASAPLGDEGEAVRRFALVEKGVAAGLALSPREAALRDREPNGGVRNLVVAPGTWDGTSDGERVVEVRRLRSLTIDRYTGEASLEIALALDRGAPITGGSLRLDLIAALARARRSAETTARGAYVGPRALLIETAALT
jgi:predicted Zn-dependent protease